MRNGLPQYVIGPLIHQTTKSRRLISPNNRPNLICSTHRHHGSIHHNTTLRPCEKW